MKKLLSILLVAVMLFVMCMFGGCNSANYGTFYSLEEAYENGYLTQEDLLSIAYYYNGGREDNEHLMPEDYSPKPIEPQELSNKIIRKMKKTYRWNFFDQHHRIILDNQIDIINYRGKYGDCYVVYASDSVACHYAKSEDLIVGKVLFKDFRWFFLRAWIEN